MLEDLRVMRSSVASAAGGSLKVRSALNPLLWLCAIVSVPSMTVAGFTSSPAAWWLIFGAVAPVAVALLCYMILMFRDPDKLQSEEYQIQKQTLQLAGQKNWDFLAEPSLPIAAPARSVHQDKQLDDLGDRQ